MCNPYHHQTGVKREAKVMARISHPFILKMVSLYQTTDSIMMLLQLVPGGELYSIMKKARRRRVPEEDTKFYTSGILEGLSHMHRRDIVHRDLKPENVLIDSDGYVVLIDMGFAKVVKDKTFTLVGSLPYPHMHLSSFYLYHLSSHETKKPHYFVHF